jgi:hypothetical protein
MIDNGIAAIFAEKLCGLMKIPALKAVNSFL